MKKIVWFTSLYNSDDGFHFQKINGYEFTFNDMNFIVFKNKYGKWVVIEKESGFGVFRDGVETKRGALERFNEMIARNNDIISIQKQKALELIKEKQENLTGFTYCKLT